MKRLPFTQFEGRVHSQPHDGHSGPPANLRFCWLLQTEQKFALGWIDSHTSAAAKLKKPLLLSEFGKTEPRDKYFSDIFNVQVSAFLLISQAGSTC